MNISVSKKHFSFKGCLAGLVFGLIVSPQLLAALTVAQTPLFLTQAAKPIVMLNISNDHQLYFKAFDDFSDLDGDGAPETSYKHSFDYFGYYDSYKCYDYSTSNNRFEPAAINTDKYCSGNWSGNFLNWASMARIDTIRKILYGGFRSTDNSTTVLERTYLPNDAHSFAKFYAGTDLPTLTPFSAAQTANGITLCNTTVNNGNALSQNVTDPPLIRVAKGDFSLWASNERWQCRWNEEKSNGNGNNSTASGISASSSSPQKSSKGLGEDDYIARVKVCVSTSLLGQEECKAYDDGSTITLKPIGLLQTYGDEDKIRFGLMTGSYRKNKSGGVLRKNVSALSDEINVSTDGTFKTAPASGGIINTLNKFRMYGYRHDDGTFHSATGSDDCIWGINSFNNDQCRNWGNPQSEILLESLRYLAGKNASSTFNTDDTSRISGLTTATYVDPIPTDQWCAPLNVIQFNASTSSYDGDELSEVTDLGSTIDVNALTNVVGVGESIPGNSFFVGENGTNNNQLCTAKTVTNLSDVRGTCPDAPRLSGSYHLAGLAHYAHTNSIRTDRDGDQLVTTYGVALSPAVPKVVVPVPGGSGNSVTILPACLDTDVGGNCAIVDFKIVSQATTATTATGKLYVNWEDSEQGGDFDQDMWGVLDYSITSTQVVITTDVIAKSTPFDMGFGYVISGTSQDGFHAHSGIEGFNYTDPTGVTGCTNCVRDDAATSNTYTIASSTASSLEQPLFYASKWGGFIDTNDNDTPDITAEWDSDGDGIPDRYFVATDPQELATSLGAALSDILLTSGSSASVATNSTRLDTNTVIYQAKFNSADWTGQFLSFTINSDGSIATNPSWDAGAILTTQGLSNRSVFSYNATTDSGIAFEHALLSVTQQALLTDNQVEYLKGDQTNEQPGGTLRKRTGSNWLLGDIINSDPWFIGNTNLGFHLLPPASDSTTTEADSYLDFRTGSAYLARKPILAIGSNDGMLHIFDATIGNTDSGKEVFAFVPDAVLANISDYTLPTYTASGQHKYTVDGSPISGDAYFDADGNSTKEWRTVVVGTTGVGGSGIFALDVTFIDPASTTYSAAETAFSTDRILWEINPTTAPTAADLISVTTGPASGHYSGFSDHLGLTMGQASIVRMANGQYVAVFGNGFNSVNQVAVLYIVDIATGDLIKSINTEAGDSSSPNGLATPITVDVNGDRVIDAIYAGDLLGNMWRFDVSSDDPDDWKIVDTPGNDLDPLYIAKDSNGVRQPITSKPQVGAHPNGGVLVYFGTGKYFETGDNIIGNSPQVQTFYGVWDECVSIAGNTSSCNNATLAGRSVLVEQTIDAEGVLGNFDVRQTSENDVDYATKKGWYMDLLTPPQPGTANGERVVSFPLLRNGRIIFTTLIPDDSSCSFGGTSWLMEIDALTGKRLEKTPFDLSGDGEINDDDLIEIFDTNGDNTTDSDDSVGASGKKSTVGIVKTPGVIGAGTVEYKYTSGSTGELEATTESVPGTSGRQSWLQLR